MTCLGASDDTINIRPGKGPSSRSGPGGWVQPSIESGSDVCLWNCKSQKPYSIYKTVLRNIKVVARNSSEAIQIL
jgi:hypothetical protein